MVNTHYNFKNLCELYSYFKSCTSRLPCMEHGKIKKASCLAAGILSDLCLIPGAGALALIAKCYKSNFNPKDHQVKQDKTPILCIHGNGYNGIQWIFFRYFLNKKGDCGSVFSLNLDGILTNDPKKGINHYADVVNAEILKIQKLTNTNKFILVGHSMGGLVASYYTEHLSIENKIEVKKVITISTPWEVPPILRKLTEKTKKISPSLFYTPERFKNMNNEGDFLNSLKKKVSESEVKYSTLYSHGDGLVPGETGKLKNGKKIQTAAYNYQGHVTPMLSPPIWKQVHKWIQEES
jgi:hypothetical protein